MDLEVATSIGAQGASGKTTGFSPATNQEVWTKTACSILADPDYFHLIAVSWYSQGNIIGLGHGDFLYRTLKVSHRSQNVPTTAGGAGVRGQGVGLLH